MADPNTKRLSKQVLQADENTFTNLVDIKGYKPANSDYTLDKATAAADAVTENQRKERLALTAYNSARDDSVAAEHARHQMSLGVKDQVVAQFGSDSNEIQALGRKKKSERKSPTRRKTTQARV